ncbi:hypothetical protein AVEN_30080-1 [Araneus ventricosus]|uniref:Uncharacterized protein n=1 Tax=Araneus ventricosus TaxID=182803 RepID=A0A4Y2H332_ARAVE|nr:hypothetical protein AVEN_30080-1 [Araneus ventricosus]
MQQVLAPQRTPCAAACLHIDSGVPCSETARRFLNAKSLVFRTEACDKTRQLGLWFRILLQLSVHYNWMRKTGTCTDEFFLVVCDRDMKGSQLKCTKSLRFISEKTDRKLISRI